MNRAKVHLGGKHKSKHGKKKPPVHEMHIRRSANKGYIAKHDFPPDEEGRAIEPDEHVIPDLDTLKAHVGEHMAEPPEEQEGEPQGEGGENVVPAQ